MIALLCPGQGADPGPLCERLAAVPAAQAIFALCREETGLYPPEVIARSDDWRLQNATAQPVIAALQLASHAALVPDLPPPGIAAGYSLGELVAHACAGALTPPDTIRLAALRGRLMAAAPAGGMLALRGLRRGMLATLAARHGAEIAITNAPDRMVLAGPVPALATLQMEAEAKGAHATPLAVGIASHSTLMRAAGEAFGRALADISFATPAFPVLSGTDASRLRSREAAIAALTRQIWQPLDWAACMGALAESGVRLAVELGPGADLSRMLAEAEPAIAARPIEAFRTPGGVAAWLRRQSA